MLKSRWAHWMRQITYGIVLCCCYSVKERDGWTSAYILRYAIHVSGIWGKHSWAGQMVAAFRGKTSHISNEENYYRSSTSLRKKWRYQVDTGKLHIDFLLRAAINLYVDQAPVLSPKYMVNFSAVIVVYLRIPRNWQHNISDWAGDVVRLFACRILLLIECNSCHCPCKANTRTDSSLQILGADFKWMRREWYCLAEDEDRSGLLIADFACWREGWLEADIIRSDLQCLIFGSGTGSQSQHHQFQGTLPWASHFMSLSKLWLWGLNRRKL